ncbi:MAG: ABC transporter ATP-binding protein [Kiloniellales bacterium]|nr:ABC transporter ATP-binding protein [Kiloniellales bacterium]
MSLLAVERLGIDFGGISAVDALDLAVEPGEIVSVIGPNGAGKTTLFNMISGIYLPARGRVLLEGEDVTALAPHRLAARGLSRTFQNLQVFQRMTALENVMAGRHLAERGSAFTDLLHLPSTRRRNRATRELAQGLLARVGLAEVAERPAEALSYGQLKRLEIARALACEPKILLLDEPAAGCNAVETEEVDELIAQIAEQGVAILLVEHDMRLVMKISSHVVVLDYGKKLAEGTPEEVSRNRLVIEAYLGAQAAESDVPEEAKAHAEG